MGTKEGVDKLPIIRQLRDVILNSDRLYKIVQIVPSLEDGPLIAYDDEANGTLDIGLTKKSYLAMFKQCHDYWYAYLEREIALNRLSRSQLEELYLMTLGYLVTANDHHSIINLHEDIVQQLGNHETDIEIVSCFLTSHLKRINKSSLLWNWMKKLTVMQVYQQPLALLYRKIVARALRSCKVHYMNYYANNFIHWVMLINSQVLYLDDGGVLFKELQRQCRDDLLDRSLWTNFKNYIDCLHGTADTEYVNDELERICKVYGAEVHIGTHTTTADPDVLILVEAEWLIKVDCKHRSPYEMLLASTQNKAELNQLLSRSTNADIQCLISIA
ncbi:Protein ECM9 [Candida viswanathii]|uniref:Protein ECM9 n=1 Tax=Candida viswanathii TaxID=5486 RepID=A0A367XP50_9ASCO|nr:Protein ECM9 [Candida viswanathii]